MYMKHFAEEEFKDFSKMDKSFLKKLDKARGIAGIPFKLTSTYRSPAYNKKIGGVNGSSHTKGCAVDISCTRSRDRFIIITALLAVGFTRIGISDNFIHVDSDTTKANKVIWTY